MTKSQIVACLASAWLACQPAFAADEPPHRPLSEWQLAAPRPASSPGFLSLQDDSEPGDVLRCVGVACGPGQVVCTTRVFPEKPEVWQGVTTTALVGDDDLALLARYGFIEDDAERLIQAILGSVAGAGRGKMLFSTAYPIAVGDQPVVISDMSYADAGEQHGFVTAVWIEKDRLHRSICTASADEASSTAAILGFLARP